jgi:hypothetical protein
MVVSFGLMVTLLALLSTAAIASPVLLSHLTNGSNTLQDQSVEFLFDRSAAGNIADGVFGEGDTVVGVLRLDNSSASGLINNQLYAVFSQTVSGPLTSIPAGATTAYFVPFAPTAVGVVDPVTGEALDLASIIGPAVLPALTTAGTPLAALYEVAGGFPEDLVSDSPPVDAAGGGLTVGVADILDFTSRVANAPTSTLDIVFGFATGGIDFDIATTSFFTVGADPTTIVGGGIGLFSGLSTAFQIASFAGGLSALAITDPSLVINPITAVLNPTTGLVTPHDLGIALGSLSGSNNFLIPDDIAGAGSFAPTFRDSQQFVLDATVVPEPASILLWGVGVVFVGLSQIWRRKKS